MYYYATDSGLKNTSSCSASKWIQQPSRYKISNYTHSHNVCMNIIASLFNAWMRIYKSMKLLYHLISNKLPNLSVHQTKMKLTSFNFNLWNHLAESLYINSFLHIQDPYLTFSPNKCNLIHLTHHNGCEKAILQISLKQHTTFTFFTGLNSNPLFFSLHTSFHAILPFLVYIKTKKKV